jgi:transcriptional regulator of acetoin/glycerol metabolism
MPNPIEVIRGELAAVDAERQQAARAHQQALAAVAKHEAKMAECEAIAARLKRILLLLDPSSDESTTAPILPPDGKHRARVTVRSVAEGFFAGRSRFTAEELQEAIRSEIAEANISTIRAELSRAKSRGDVAKRPDGTWVSRIARASDKDLKEDEPPEGRAGGADGVNESERDGMEEQADPFVDPFEDSDQAG